MRITDNFRLSEFTKTSHPVELHPKREYVNNIINLCTNTLQPIRDSLGVPLVITSGYRNPELNALVNGTWDSGHLEAKDADFYIKRRYRWGSGLIDSVRIMRAAKFGKLIYYPDKNRFHISSGVDKRVFLKWDKSSFYHEITDEINSLLITLLLGNS